MQSLLPPPNPDLHKESGAFLISSRVLPGLKHIFGSILDWILILLHSLEGTGSLGEDAFIF